MAMVASTAVAAMVLVVRAEAAKVVVEMVVDLVVVLVAAVAAAVMVLA